MWILVEGKQKQKQEYGDQFLAIKVKDSRQGNFLDCDWNVVCPIKNKPYPKDMIVRRWVERTP